MRRSRWCVVLVVCAVLNVAASDDQMRINPAPPPGWTPSQPIATGPQPGVSLPSTVPAWAPPAWTPPPGLPEGVGVPVEMPMPQAPVFGMAYGQVSSRSAGVEGAYTVVVKDQQEGDVTLVVQPKTSQITRNQQASTWETLQVGEWVDVVYQLSSPAGEDLWDPQTKVTNLVVYVDVVQPDASSAPGGKSTTSSATPASAGQ